jgi:tetratricopeptide (TPR) repeat protein
MRLAGGGVVALVAFVGVLSVPLPLRAQQSDDRVTRAAQDLFSRAEHVDADIAELKAALAADPKSAQAHMLLGIAYRAKASPELLAEAIGELRQAVTLDPSLIPAYLYLAHLYLDLSRPDRAKEELQAALNQAPGQPQLQALLAECERQLGNPNDALDLAQKALAANPSLAEARFYEGKALYDLGRRDEAIADFERVVKEGGQRFEVYSSLGTAYLDLGRADQAIDSLTDAIKMDPSRPEPMIQLARAYRMKGDVARAELPLAHARTLIGQAVTTADQQVERDWYVEEGVLRLQMKQIGAAARALKKAVDLDSSFGPGHRYLAEVYIRQGLYTQAQDQAVRAEKLGSPLPAALRKTLDEKLRAGRPKGRP